ncbi:MAG: hypothetical protein A2271_01795 [Candidatus Moranbacteria bacterium RIFOXYA12_FULL_35_19]|nr:MAG: hypothetical protein UR78_C0032G0005 [Candidatus Moranbacteria bacterium GW2011_GWF2_35_39]OGI32420.1 MAG: hypothetical protein A2489_02255 [Candidatus Moranbacteria bacterium RIFOXYC12_FULL_36_13]OGI32997.1 MAG: hypothetical protein A2343_00730 [Candidatus Moranbacteria bacterium RIFOXYB12_FULL_35_8]OGI35504.1 MAG: hypothetical protein A2271_01795 [Candidatus Moranbacteria bacterium RIFOXYA12_FULL_35_19]
MYEFMENKKDFLQSNEWRKFQEAVGRKTFCVTSPPASLAGRQSSPYKGEGVVEFSASIIEHKLPIVGKYFYIPRGPVFCHPKFISGSKKEILKQVQHDIQELIKLAKKEKAGWIRIEPENEEILEEIKKWTSNVHNGHLMSIAHAPHDMQPKETLIMDISKSEEEILAGMKSKTRYNIKLAEKKGISLRITNLYECTNNKKNDVEEFLRLTKIMSERQGIVTHDENYYRKMLEIIPKDIIKLYVAEYENPASTREDDRSSTRGGKIIAANIILFYGDTATYLHGASDDKYKNLMAPYLLQWRQIQDAKKAGCEKYDFGGISTNYESSTNVRITNKWKGITRFKLGFSPSTKPVEFPGSYDIVISPVKYWVYRIIQKVKSCIG